MSPQFVDYNADGHMDIVTATFDGSPHISYGSKDGFQKPQHFLDRHGKRIMLSQFWNYEDKKWDENKDQPKGQFTSAVAFDWDADGDYDLILGSYKGGTIYRQMNEGTNQDPKFTGVNVPVHTAGKPFALAGGVTTPRLVDWDGDGLTDLLCGSFGDSYGEDLGGGVWVYRNVGKLGAPKFGEAMTLIPASTKGQTEPTRPDAGLYADAVDYDGDGDLDLIVGGYSQWREVQLELSPSDKARAETLQEEMNGLTEKFQGMFEANFENMAKDASPEELEAGHKKFRETEAYKKLMAELQSKGDELRKLIPAPKRETFVWLYRRISARAAF